MRVLGWLLLGVAGCSTTIDPLDVGPDTDTRDTDPPIDTDDTDPVDTDDTDVVVEPVTIQAIQSGAVDIGDVVTVAGAVVTGVHDYGVWIGDRAGGKQSGIYVYLGLTGSKWDRKAWARGDEVTVTGKVVEYTDGTGIGTLTEISVLWSDKAQGLTKTGLTAEPPPTQVSVTELTSASTAEPYEGVLVSVRDGVVTNPDLGFGEFELSGLAVDDEMVQYDPVYEGDAFTEVIGVLHFAFGAFKLEPRARPDFVGYDSSVVKSDTLGAGALVITEIMIDPDDLDCDPETEGEYLEIYNPGPDTIDLAGLSVTDAAGVTSTIDEPALVGPGGYVFGIGTPKANFCYASVLPAFTYKAAWNNGGDKVFLANAKGTIDAVDFLTWSPPKGTSLSLSATKRDATSNDAASAWCATPKTAIIDGGTDAGTPGVANAACP
jgi:hypothetical protein